MNVVNFNKIHQTVSERQLFKLECGPMPNVMVSQTTRGYRILEDGRVVFVVEVLVETQCSVLSGMGPQEV